MESQVQNVAGSALFPSYLLVFLGEGHALLVGMAMCGALVYVMHSQEMGLWERMISVFIATFMGYGVASSLAEPGLLQSIVAFVTATIGVAVSRKVLDYIQEDDKFVHKIISYIEGFFGGKK